MCSPDSLTEYSCHEYLKCVLPLLTPELGGFHAICSLGTSPPVIAALSADWLFAFWGTGEYRMKRKTGSISRLPAENCVDLHLIRGYLLIAPHLTNDFLQCLSVHITRVTFPPLPPPSSLFVAKCQIQLNEWRCHSAALATGIISVHAQRKPAACKKKPH